MQARAMAAGSPQELLQLLLLTCILIIHSIELGPNTPSLSLGFRPRCRKAEPACRIQQTHHIHQFDERTSGSAGNVLLLLMPQ
jgi:hypothetical protein